MYACDCFVQKQGLRRLHVFNQSSKKYKTGTKFCYSNCVILFLKRCFPHLPSKIVEILTYLFLSIFFLPSVLKSFHQDLWMHKLI